MLERTDVRVALGAVLLVGVAAGGATMFVLGSDLSYESPTVASMTSEFGAVGNESAEITTRVVVDNPNERALPAGATVRYAVTMEGVRVATGERGGVRLPPGRSTVAIDGSFDSGQIPSWWVRHVNAGEQSVVRVRPSVRVAGVIDRDLPERKRTVETDLLGPFASATAREMAIADRRVLRVTDQRAEWGEATAERTPVRVRMTLRNVHDYPVQLDGTAYEIRMNDVVVGEGQTEDGVHLAPGESGTLTVRAHVNTSRMQRWWVSHLRANETTELRVTVDGVVVDDGERTRLPVAVFEQRARFRSDVLGSGNTSVELLDPADGGESVVEPEVQDTHSRWGPVGDDSSTVVTDVVVSNPNGEAVADLLGLDLRQRTVIHGVEAAAGERTVDGLPVGTGNVTVRSAFSHDAVPVWWARHLNAGERSTVRTTSEGTVDVGVTRFDASLDDRERVVTTDTLAGLNNDTAQAVTADGRTLLTVERTNATYGEATPEHAPVIVRATVTNERARTVTLRDLRYTVALNDVTLGDGVAEETYTLGPHETRTVEYTLDLDNSKMAAWWPTHVRNGERSELRTTAELTVETPFDTKTVELDSLSGNRTVETNVLGSE